MTEKIKTLSFTEAIKSAISKICQFKGRARRSEYWWTMLAIYIVDFVLAPFLGIFGLIINVITLYMTFPLTFRRLHDSGKSGWWWGAGAIIAVAMLISLAYDLYSSLSSGIMFKDLKEIYTTIFTYLAKYYIWLIIISIYQIIMFIFMFLDSQPFKNKYGESPKYRDTDTTVQKPANS